jgi:hypothetical protein
LEGVKQTTNNRVITSSGVMSGNVLIKDIDVNTVVPLVNVTRAEITLPKGTFLGFAVVANVTSQQDEISLDQTAIESNAMLPCDSRCGKSQPRRDVITDQSQALVKPETAILQSSITEPMNMSSMETFGNYDKVGEYCRCKCRFFTCAMYH